MNTDMKWFALVMIAIIVLPMGGLALEQYNKGQCRIEAIKAGMEPDKIGQVCK